MKNILAILIAVFAFTCVQAEGIEFFEGTWKEALELANKEDKLIFVDAYTTWCGPCKAMAKNIFPLKEAGDFYNANFINMKMDMEKGEGRTIRTKYNVNAFPTFLFINGAGEMQYTSKGGKPIDRFIGMGEEALKRFDNSGQFADKYEEGDRDPELLRKYAVALAKASKPESAKVANEFLRTKPDFSILENLNFLYDATTYADSRIFSLFIKNKTAIAAQKGDEAVAEKIEKVCKNTVSKAIEYKEPALLAEAKTKMQTNAPSKFAAFDIDSDMMFAEAMEDSKTFLKAADKYIKANGKNNALVLHKMASRVVANEASNAKMNAQALKWASKAAENGGEAKYLFTQAQLLHANGKNKEALQIAEQLKATAEQAKNRKLYQGADLLIRKIKEVL